MKANIMFYCLLFVFVASGCHMPWDDNPSQPDASYHYLPDGGAPDAKVVVDAGLPDAIAQSDAFLPDANPPDAFVCSPAACGDGQEWTNDYCTDGACDHAPGDCGGVQFLANSAANLCVFWGGFNGAPVVEWVEHIEDLDNGTIGEGSKIAPVGACTFSCGLTTGDEHLEDGELLPIERVTVEWKGAPENAFMHQEFHDIRVADWSGNNMVPW